MKPRILPLAVVGVLLLSACGTSNAPTSSSQQGGSVSLWAEWSSGEQAALTAGLSPLESQSGTTLNYSSKGSNIDAVLAAAVAGGAPPDVALIPDPGTLQTLAKQGKLTDLTSILSGLSSNFGSALYTSGAHQR